MPRCSARRKTTTDKPGLCVAGHIATIAPRTELALGSGHHGNNICLSVRIRPAALSPCQAFLSLVRVHWRCVEGAAPPQPIREANVSPRKSKELAQDQQESAADPVAEATPEVNYPRIKPAGWHDNDTGVELVEYIDKPRGRYEMHLLFRDGDPGVKVREYIKENHFRGTRDTIGGNKFPDVEYAWAHPVGYNTGAQDRLHSQRVAAQVVKMIREEKGIEAPAQEQRIPF